MVFCTRNITISVVCLEVPFGGGSWNIDFSHLICIADRLVFLFVVRVFARECFRGDKSTEILFGFYCISFLMVIVVWKQLDHPYHWIIHILDYNQKVKSSNFEQMNALDESTGPLVIWRLLFTFVFLECLNIHICFIFFTNILIYKLLFFIVFSLSLPLDEFMRVFPFFDAG